MSGILDVGDLITLAMHGQAGTTKEEEEEYKLLKLRMNADLERKEAISKEVAEIFTNAPIRIDRDTAFQLVGQLKYGAEEGDKRLYNIIMDDLLNARAVIGGQLKDSYPNWVKDYTLQDIDVNLFADDEPWQRYLTRNQFYRLRIPGRSSVIMPICMRFREKVTGENPNPLVKEIRFVDVHCVTSLEPLEVERVYMLHCDNVRANER